MFYFFYFISFLGIFFVELFSLSLFLFFLSLSLLGRFDRKEGKVAVVWGVQRERGVALFLIRDGGGDVTMGATILCAVMRGAEGYKKRLNISHGKFM